MNGSPSPALPVTPADMEELKSICSLIQAGRISWDSIVALHTKVPPVARHAAPAETRTPAEQALARALRDALATNHGHELQFTPVVDTLITHLFDRSLGLLPREFQNSVEEARKAA